MDINAKMAELKAASYADLDTAIATLSKKTGLSGYQACHDALEQARMMGQRINDGIRNKQPVDDLITIFNMLPAGGEKDVAVNQQMAAYDLRVNLNKLQPADAIQRALEMAAACNEVNK